MEATCLGNNEEREAFSKRERYLPRLREKREQCSRQELFPFQNRSVGRAEHDERRLRDLREVCAGQQHSEGFTEDP